MFWQGFWGRQMRTDAKGRADQNGQDSAPRRGNCMSPPPPPLQSAGLGRCEQVRVLMGKRHARLGWGS